MQFDLLARDGAARRARLQFLRGTVETRPEERSNFRLSWWRASFHASLGFRQGEWLTLAADDLGRI